MLDFTPPAVPGSSPKLMLYSEPLMAIILLFFALTVLVPFFSVPWFAVLGYGIGTGPPGVGVLQTSGIVAIDMPIVLL